MAEGLTSSELEQAIHSAYVPDYYTQMTVNILVPCKVTMCAAKCGALDATQSFGAV